MPRLSFTQLLLASTALVLVITQIPSLDFATLTVADGLRTLLSAFLTATVLSFVLTYSRRSGWQAIVLSFLVYWGILHFNTLNEAIFFGLDLGGERGVLQMGLSSILSVALVSVGMVVLAGRWEAGAEPPADEATPPHGAMGWTWRLLASAFCYFVFYFIAGMIIFPFVKEYYADKTMPTLVQIFVMQIIRGMVYTGLGVMVMRAMTTRWKVTALTMGAALSILGGIAPLLPPNPLMPESVRMVHMAEIGVSNFLFGFVMVRILHGGKRTE